jgi:hypothetical protein
MNEITRSLRDSKTARWGALAVVSFTMLTGYYINYVISPLKPLLENIWVGTAPILESGTALTAGLMYSF